MERLKFAECAKCSDYDGSIVNCFNICGKPMEAMEEYNRLKDLEEQGLLLKLPCNVEDGEDGYDIRENTEQAIKQGIEETIGIVKAGWSK